MVFYGSLNGNVVTEYISCTENRSLDILQNNCFSVLQKKDLEQCVGELMITNTSFLMNYYSFKGQS